jgi:hypothetical protein
MSVANLQRMLVEKKNRLQQMESQARGPQLEMQSRDIDRLIDDLPHYYQECGARLWPKQQGIDTLIKRRFPDLVELRDEVRRLEKRIAEMEANPAPFGDIRNNGYRRYY